MALPEGYSFTRPGDRMYSGMMPSQGMRYAYGPNGERKAVPDPRVGAASQPVNKGPSQITIDPLYNENLRPDPDKVNRSYYENRTGGGSNPIEQFLATLHPAQREQFLALPPEQQQAYASGGAQNLNPGNNIGGVQPINPVLQDIKRQEVISDPNVRELYFGSPDYGGLISEARGASQKYLNQGPTMRQTAGLSPLETSAIQGAYGGIGGYKPYLQAQEKSILDGMGMLGEQRNLVGEAIGATRRSGEMQQPYFAQAQQQYEAGLGDLMSSFGQQGPSARDYQRASLQGFDPRSAAAYGMPSEVMQPFVGSAREQTAQGLQSLLGGAAREQEMGAKALAELQRGVGQEQVAREAGLRELRGGAEEARTIARETGRATFDPSSTAAYNNPFENQVVNQTIEDVMKAGDMQDIQQRASDISQGGESAFGSRARLTADERRASLGRGLGEALSSIRQGGFDRSQQTALGEFARQQSALERSGSALAGLGQQVGSGFERFGAGQLGSSQLLSGQIRGLGSTAADRAAQEQAARYGAASSEVGIGSNLSGLSEQAFQNAIGESRFGRGALERAGQTEAGYGQALSGARRGYAEDMLGIGQQRGDLARGIGSSLAGYGQNIGGIGSSMAGYGSQLGGLGASYQQLGQNERQELMNLGGTARDLKDTQLGRQYEYSEAQRSDPMRAMQFVQGFAPQYQSGQTQVNKTYGMPRDPRSEGLAAFLNTYSQFQGNNQQQNQGQNQQQNQGQNQNLAPATNPNYQYQAGNQPYYTPGQTGQTSPFDINNPYAPPTGTGYQGGPVNTQGAFNSNQYNPLNPNPYQPGQGNYGPTF